MMEKILLVAPDYYGFNEVVFEGLKKYSGAEVSHIISNENYIYKNLFEKITNFFSKLFLKKNLKKTKAAESILRKICNSTEIDLSIINRPDLLSGKQLDLILKNSVETIAILWDSLEKIPVEEGILKKLTSVLSFDQADCEKYNFKKITNFYFEEKIDSLINIDIAFLGTFDERFPILVKILNQCKEDSLRTKAKIYSYQPKSINEENIENINQIISFSSSFKYYLDAFAILDLAQLNQEGLSFRPFEAMGLEKKLITTNKNVRNYDFYDVNNIFVIDDYKNFKIPEKFFLTPYKKLSKEITEKYFIKYWIQNIVNNF